jgi:ubiquinone/menaquinone biosynthesis C-methylase UbiE
VSFDAVAPWYRTLETIAFGDDLQRCRVACLGEISFPRRALIVGEGNGRFLCELLRFHPSLEVDCVDASERMLRLARERIDQEFPGLAYRVRFVQRDIESWTPPEREYDLIVTHFVLDCLRSDQMPAVIEKLANAAAADATWLLADFAIPTRGLARRRARVWLAVMYRFFRCAAGIHARELVEASPFLRAAGFDLARQHFFRNGMLKSELWRNTGILPVRPADMMSAAP